MQRYQLFTLILGVFVIGTTVQAAIPKDTYDAIENLAAIGFGEAEFAACDAAAAVATTPDSELSTNDWANVDYCVAGWEKVAEADAWFEVAQAGALTVEDSTVVCDLGACRLGGTVTYCQRYDATGEPVGAKFPRVCERDRALEVLPDGDLDIRPGDPLQRKGGIRGPLVSPDTDPVFPSGRGFPVGPQQFQRVPGMPQSFN